MQFPVMKVHNSNYKPTHFWKEMYILLIRGYLHYRLYGIISRNKFVSLTNVQNTEFKHGGNNELTAYLAAVADIVDFVASLKIRQ